MSIYEHRPWLQNAPERCEYCHKDVYADEESELFVTRDGDGDCPQAPKRVNPGGAVFGEFNGCHEPG